MKRFYIANHNEYYATMTTKYFPLGVVEQASMRMVEVGWLDYVIYCLLKRNVYAE